MISLDLTNNNITNESGDSIHDFLVESGSIMKLSLADNKIGNLSVEKIALASANPTCRV